MNEVMMIMFQKRDRKLFRFVILGGPADIAGPYGEPDMDQVEWLSIGKWVKGIEEARRQGLEVYFRMYRERYGFAHPEDPDQSGAEAPDDVRIVVYADSDPDHLQTHTPGHLHGHPVH